MVKVFQYSGWVVAVMLLFCCGILMNKYLTAEKARGMAEKMLATGPLLESTRENDLEKRLAEAEAALGKALGELQTLKRVTPGMEGSTPEKGLPEESPRETDSAKDDDKPDFDEPAQAERIARAQMAAVANMIYADLLQELDLGPEQSALLKEAIAASMGKQQKIVAGAMRSENRSAKSVRAERDTLRTELREELQDVLNTEDLAAFDEYEAVADQILLEKTVDSQLGALASGLSSENRVLTSQVMAEELVREFDVFDQSDELYTLDNFNAAQTRALNATLERLAETLAEDQWSLVDGFVSHALTMFEAMSDKDGEG